MTSPAGEPTQRAAVALRSMGEPNSIVCEFDFWRGDYERGRLVSEVLGTFFLVLVAVGGGVVNARFGGNAVPMGARVVAPGLMVAAIILFVGTVSGAHLNPAVSLAFALRGDFPWRRVPAYILAQFVGATIAALLLHWAVDVSATFGSNYVAGGYSEGRAYLMEALLPIGSVTLIL